MICLFYITKEAAYVQNAWRELPEIGVGRRHILGVLRLALIPLSRDSRGAQDDKSELISSKETIFTAVRIQTDPSVDRRDHRLAHLQGSACEAGGVGRRSRKIK